MTNKTAAIDALLRLARAQQAEALEVKAGQPPELLIGGGRRALSMPALAPALLESFVQEIVEHEALEGVSEEDGLEVEYTAPAIGDFSVRLQRQDGVLALEFRAGKASRAVSKPATEPTPTRSVSSLETVLRDAVERGVADVIFTEGSPPVLRPGRGLERLSGPVVTEQGLRELLANQLTAEHEGELQAQGSVDLAVEFPGMDQAPHRFRANVFRQRSGLSAVFRPISRRVPGLAELHLPATIRRFTEFPFGLVLMTGPAGSGKSTTLAALVEHLNRTAEKHIITLEDPIEYLYPAGRCHIQQRELGQHVRSFAEGLRAALREAPDVILVGEMRDTETVSAALTAAETGHLILSTLHCGTSAMAVDRIIDLFAPARQSQIRLQLADVLRCVVTQRLVSTPRPPERLPVLEILPVNYAVASLIREGRTHQIRTQLQTGRDQGLRSLERSLADLVREGRILAEDAFQAAASQQELAELLGHEPPR